MNTCMLFFVFLFSASFSSFWYVLFTFSYFFQMNFPCGVVWFSISYGVSILVSIFIDLFVSLVEPFRLNENTFISVPSGESNSASSMSVFLISFICFIVSAKLGMCQSLIVPTAAIHKSSGLFFCTTCQHNSDTGMFTPLFCGLKYFILSLSFTLWWSIHIIGFLVSSMKSWSTSAMSSMNILSAPYPSTFFAYCFVILGFALIVIPFPSFFSLYSKRKLASPSGSSWNKYIGLWQFSSSSRIVSASFCVSMFLCILLFI